MPLFCNRLDLGTFHPVEVHHVLTAMLVDIATSLIPSVAPPWIRGLSLADVRLTSQPKVLITNMSPEKYCSGWKMLEDYLPFDMFLICSLSEAAKPESESMNV